jgi:hypothetical protein
MKRPIALLVLAVLVATAAHAADAPKMTADQQAMMEKMTKAATPGPHHEMFKKMAGEWTTSIKMQMDPSQPAQESQGAATITTLMDGRYCQEQATSQMMGMPFSGMGVYGYDNVMGKYVSSWIDNMGTGIMSSTGTPDASGKVITWDATMSDPITGKATKERMVTTFTDDNHYTLEMYGTPPGMKKEMKTMTIAYSRKQ